MIGGKLEPLHGHNWQVEAVIEGAEVDGDGLLCDFHAVERVLDEILAPFNNRNLNKTPPFDRVNPSAEHVARHICERLAAGLELTSGPGGGSDIGSESRSTRVASVSVSEAPGCVATYRP